ncbi:hypothetical protein A3Q56_04068 [Intoshia linei]|uniref:2-oxoacid dehydrogenase acyltransferase catalytic domain-containing protein n=1 Tax=Intoshia linei TaxID=1819745 RepID=A0A177B3L7_9BILA|nr:hypothetical protein A3Q56_04068 [Intoshia linei]
MVPNIKNVEKKSIIEISKEMKRIIKYGMQNQLLPHDVLHGTFTLSNIGSIGGTYAMPIIMPPQLCIGAIGKISEKLKLNDIKDKSISQVYSASYLNISWSADHRVIDGATMTKFSNLWKKYIEHPLLMLKIAK